METPPRKTRESRSHPRRRPSHHLLTKESRIRIVSFRAALAIAACLVITFIVTRFIYVPKSTITSKSTIVNYSAKPEPPAFAAESSEVANESESLAMNGKRERSAAFRRRESAPRDQLAGGFDRPDDARQESPAQLEGNLLRANKELSEITQALPSIEMAGEASAMAEAIPSDESIPQVQRKPSVPSNSAAKVIASSTTSPTATPIPSEALAMNAPADFGNGHDLGDSWADKRNADFSPQPQDESQKLAELNALFPDGNLDGFINYGSPINKNKELVLPNFPITPATPTVFEDQDSYPNSRGVEYKIHLDYKSEYLFRGIDLSKKSKPLLPDLTQETLATQDPFSTFSLNISDTSFQLARAAIERGERPDPASIKPEQFYNAINYGDPAPSSREPVAAAIDQTAHPIIPGRNLVRIAVRTASTGRSAAQPLRLTLLVDQSGSMIRADRRAAMETALAQLSTLLTEQDQITVIGFSRTPRLLADSLPGNQANRISDLVNQTASEGGTNLEQAITLASELALRHKLDGAQNRIVLFTDGAANLGDADPERLSQKVETLRQQGLAFDIAGIGTDDINDKLLAELARHGNGRYYLVGENTATSLAAQLAGAFRPAAENVKIQVKFNPERVGNYKLIGFDEDRLKTEDFHNDSVDAAELAADEAGVAMYQIQALPEGSGEIGEVSIRFRDTASGEMVERAWTIPYDATAPAFDKADPKTQLATLALLSAQKLQGGPLADAINLRNFSQTIATLRQAYKSDSKIQQFLTLVEALK